MNALPTESAASDALATMLAEFSAAEGWATYAAGAPPEGDTGWHRVDAFLEPAYIEAAIDHLIELYYEGQPRAVVGNYLFRDVIHYPLAIAGFCFATTQRVPRLTANVTFHEVEPYGARVIEAQLSVLPTDSLAGQPGVTVVADAAALADELIAEVRRVVTPLLDRFRAERYVAPANAWGSVLDSVNGGMLAAGRGGLGLDVAWQQWDALIEGRTFATRRRPRRLQYEFDATPTETQVRAGCCLWYMTDDAKASDEGHFCTTCYLETDAIRIEHLVAYERERLEAAAAPSSGDE